MKWWMILLMLLAVSSCKQPAEKLMAPRNFVDTIGFAHLAWQMDSIIVRIERSHQDTFGKQCRGNLPLKVAICPHDDYSLAGPLYYSVIRDVHAKIVIMFGVAHKARLLGIENKIVFASYKSWLSPLGKIDVALDIQNAILAKLDTSVYEINDSLQKLEHSLEAITPFLEHFSPGMNIIPILVPAMPADRMEEIAVNLSKSLNEIILERKLEWGKDFAMVISTDAVHYGDEDWGGKNFAAYGADTLGYWMAVDHEKLIIRDCLIGKLSADNCRRFYDYTVQADNFREYKWTWCGRYSVPFGLFTAEDLGKLQSVELEGCEYGYLTGLDHPRIKVDDLRMGLTNPVKLRHWVGYAAIGYR